MAGEFSFPLAKHVKNPVTEEGFCELPWVNKPEDCLGYIMGLRQGNKDDIYKLAADPWNVPYISELWKWLYVKQYHEDKKFLKPEKTVAADFLVYWREWLAAEADEGLDQLDDGPGDTVEETLELEDKKDIAGNIW